jgi:hypothetical protein
MDADDLVIIGDKFTMSVENEFAQHPPVSLIDQNFTMRGLVPQSSSPAHEFATKRARLCHGCSAWDFNEMHHERIVRPEPHLCEAVAYESPTNVEEQCQSKVVKIGPQPLEFHRRESPEPVVAQLPIQLSLRDRKGCSEVMESARRFSTPVSENSSLKLNHI